MERLLEVVDLKVMSRRVRQDVLVLLNSERREDIVRALSLVDLVTALSFNVMTGLAPRNSEPNKRDRLIVSADVPAVVWYAAFGRAGFFALEELSTFNQHGSRFQVHLNRTAVPGIQAVGERGNALSIACGSAMAAAESEREVFCIMSDHDQTYGSTWEAARLAAQFELGQLTLIIHITEATVEADQIRERYLTLGWHVLDIDANEIQQITDACGEAHTISGMPVCILAHTQPMNEIPPTKAMQEAPSENEINDILDFIREQS